MHFTLWNRNIWSFLLLDLHARTWIDVHTHPSHNGDLTLTKIKCHESNCLLPLIIVEKNTRKNLSIYGNNLVVVDDSAKTPFTLVYSIFNSKFPLFSFPNINYYFNWLIHVYGILFFPTNALSLHEHEGTNNTKIKLFSSVKISMINGKTLSIKRYIIVAFS